MVLTFKPAQLHLLAIPVAVLLALGQEAAVAAGPFAYPEPNVPPQSTEMRQPSAEAIPAPQPGPRQFLATPVLNENPQAPAVPPAAPAATDRPLPINLATALCLSNARPLVIAFAENSVELAAAQLQHAKVMWLPDFNVGIDYYRHDGYDQETEGPVINVSKSYFAAGAGATLDFGITDAIFLPLAARQELSASEFAVEAARNDALATVATTYFDVQEARGRLAGNLDAISKAEDLERQIKGLAETVVGGIVKPLEVNRVLALRYDLEQEAAASRAAWQTSSARLNRVLRLNPGAVVVPVEPPQLQVTLIPPGRAVDDLIPVGLLNRPELASQKALVQATLERLRQERLRPLLPSVVLTGGGPGGAFTGGIFEGSPNDEPYTGAAASTWSWGSSGPSITWCRQQGLGAGKVCPATASAVGLVRYAGPRGRGGGPGPRPA